MKQTQLWSEEECKRFVALSKQYFNDFYQIAAEMNRSYSQIRSHYYNIVRQTKLKGDKKEKQSKRAHKQSYIIFDDLQ
ncbi:SANT/Myb_domain [Hexamita inflata]|uniref:SANT/Myb domain n=1 Tax=Hexamita inflata TaxID=28002 RepID=A0AA86RDI7_9EUKA|nr:SANT/Myb domain [Hexamita inflata]